MNATRLIAAFVGIALLAAASGAAADVKWMDQSAWDEALARAKAENKYVVVDFWAIWCGPCKEMDKTTFKDGKVIEFLNSNIPVKVDVEEGRGVELAEEYRIVYKPTTMLISPDGKEINRHLGRLYADEYMEKINGWLEGKWTISWYEEKLHENPDDIDLLMELGTKHVDAVRPDPAADAFERVLALDPNDELGRRGEILFQLGDVYLSTDRYGEAEKYFQRLIENFPDGDWQDRGLQRLASAQHKQGRSDEAVATFRRYLERHPDDPRAMNGFAWFCSQRAIGLDEALPVALKAAELSNRDPGILDTLAEVYYARGEYDKAITVMKECVQQEPDDEYFERQMQKYRSAKAESDAQASR